MLVRPYLQQALCHEISRHTQATAPGAVGKVETSGCGNLLHPGHASQTYRRKPAGIFLDCYTGMSQVQPAQRVKKILIVDDDQTLSQLLLHALSTEDRVLITAPTINSAREILKNEDVDLILLDLYLPDGSGLNLLSDLNKHRDNGDSRHPGAIIMTAFGDWESHVKSYRLGAFYYLDKPFKVMQLRLLVEQALQKTA